MYLQKKMIEEQEFYQKEKNIGKLIAVILLTIIIVIAGILAVLFIIIPETANNEKNGKVLATSYENISVEDAYFLITTEADTLIIDTRSCACNYNYGGHIENLSAPIPYQALCNACTSDKPYYTGNHDIYNATGAIIVYDNSGSTDSRDYCEALIGYTYGKIYHLIGGFSAWKQAGYPYQTVV